MSHALLNEKHFLMLNTISPAQVFFRQLIASFSKRRDRLSYLGNYVHAALAQHLHRFEEQGLNKKQKFILPEVLLLFRLRRLGQAEGLLCFLRPEPRLHDTY